MKKFSTLLVGAAATLLGAAPALAQVSLTGFAPYTQNFNSLPTSTAQANFVNNSTLPGVYAQAMLTGLGAYPGGTSPVPYYGNDGGQSTDANYYSFGTIGSTDRALGGIATTFIANGYPLTGTGYVAMRFKNQTGRPIANLEVSYAMEQWYNSGKVDKAQVGFDYQVLSSAFTGAMEAGIWTPEPALGVAAPSTATTIASKNGNAPANRRVLTATLRGLNLAVGQEIVLRWKYVLNKDTNGNGLAIDDVTVTPEAGGQSERGRENDGDPPGRRDGRADGSGPGRHAHDAQEGAISSAASSLAAAAASSSSWRRRSSSTTCVRFVRNLATAVSSSVVRLSTASSMRECMAPRVARTSSSECCVVSTATERRSLGWATRRAYPSRIRRSTSVLAEAPVISRASASSFWRTTSPRCFARSRKRSARRSVSPMPIEARVRARILRSASR